MADNQENFDIDAARALLALAATEKAPAGPCPSAEEIAAWQAKALSEDDATRLNDHVAHCTRCLELWAGMLEATGALEPTENAARDRRSSTRRWRGAAVAASVVVVFIVAGVLLKQFAVPTPLPPYTLQIDDRMRVRGLDVDSDTVVNYGTGDVFVLSARPATAVAEPVSVQVFVDSGAGAVKLSLPTARTAASGAVQIAGTVGLDVQLPEGSSVLYVIVGRAGELPAIEMVTGSLADETRTTERDWTAWRLPLSVQRSEQ